MKDSLSISKGVTSLLKVFYYLWLAGTIIYTICWIFDATQPQPSGNWLNFNLTHPGEVWLNLNLTHPILMYTGLASITVFVCIYATKIIAWLDNL